MFRKIESYVTPIILSHVDKYIKNFKTEDTQVSLWSGAVVLHNMELRSNVIQDEFNLPFYLSSGYIHELIIHVPWMKIMSEPIMITINTIECVLTLKTESSSEAKNHNKKNRNIQETPPGYVQSLVNRIVNNISFRCNNLILKYVEEDIVVSINIKHLYLDSVNGNWEPTFSDISMEDLHIRKLITLSDLTLCLDKRNAAGKIETFLEPLLYRCEMKIKLDSAYSGLLQKNPLYVRCHINSPKIEISISHQQVPMIIRLAALFWALKKKHLKIIHIPDTNRENASNSNTLSTSDLSESFADNADDSWSSWALSFMTPIYSSDEEESTNKKSDTIFLFGMDLKYVSMVFKIPESCNTSIAINNKRSKQFSTAKLVLHSVISETSSHIQRLCFRGGFKKIELFPENHCICGIKDGDVYEKQQTSIKFLESTTNIDEIEDLSWPVEYEGPVSHSEMDDKTLTSICPAVVMEYTYTLTLPEDYEDTLSEINTDLEYSNFKESTVLNVSCGPITWHISAGLIHRISMIKSVSETYDYAPYSMAKPLLKKSELPPPTTDDYDTFVEFIPKFLTKVCISESKIILSVWDHPDTIEDSFISGLSTHRKFSTSHDAMFYYKSLQKIPHLLFDIGSIEFTLLQPLYPIRLTYVICQLPDPPSGMFDACHKIFNIKANNLRCSLSQRLNDIIPADAENVRIKLKDISLPILNDCTFHFISKKLILPQYWMEDNSIIIDDYSLNIDNISFCGTMPKLLTSYNIMMGAMDNDYKNKYINLMLKSSLLSDIHDDMVHLELDFEGIMFRIINLKNTSTYRLVVNNIKVFAIKSSQDQMNDETVWVFCAPDTNKNLSGPFLKTVYQISTDDLYSTFLTAKIEESSLVFDPVLYQFITYRYLITHPVAVVSKEKSPTPKRPSSEKTHGKHSVEESTVHQGSKTSYKYTSLQSQSEREKDFVHSSTPTALPNTIKNKEPVETHYLGTKKESLSRSDTFAKFLYNHKNTAISIEMEALTVYFPTKPISAVNCQTVNDAVNASVLLDSNYHLESILIVRLPNIHLKSSSLKKHLLDYCIHGLPSKLPCGIWEPDLTSYPWQINLSNMSSFTLSKSEENSVVSRNFLKPVTSNIAISVTTKLNNEVQETSTSIDQSTTIKVPNSQDELTSLATVVHIDVGWLILSVNQFQVSTLSLVLHGFKELSNSFNVHEDVISSSVETKDQSTYFSFNEQFSIENSCASDTQSGKNISKTQKGLSWDDSGINEDSNTKEDGNIPTSTILLTSWIQLTISRFTIKCYANYLNKAIENISSNKNDIKLVFDIEDIMTSLDVHPEYIKVKCKMVTANVKYYKRDIGLLTWNLGEHNGIILRGRENDGPLKQNEETSFIKVTLTFARCSSVHNKWNETGKKIIRKFDNAVGEFIWEIEISMQSLDIILNPHCIEPFLAALSPACCDIKCDNVQSIDKNKNKSSTLKSLRRPEMWSSSLFPLCYFESRQIRFLMPKKHKLPDKSHDVIVFQVDKFSIIPVAENPMCRQTLRPDLYEVAAREGWLGLPGSPLEDRQTQLSFKGISMYTCHWSSIAQMEEPDDNSVNENPALRWNNLSLSSASLNSDQFISIFNNVDLYVVFVLAMFHKTTLVSGPAVDIGLMTDTDVNLSISQVKLFSSLYNEYINAFTNAEKDLNHSNQPDLHIVRKCKFSKYIMKNSVQTKKKSVSSKLSESKSSISIALLNTEEKPSTQATDKRDKISNCFDVIFTMGKITFILYENTKAINKGTGLVDIVPLFYIMLHQPNFFMSIHQTNTAMQFSIFSAQISLSNKKAAQSLSTDLFQLHLLETKPGIPDESTGISPSMLITRIERNAGSKYKIKTTINCPIMFSISELRLNNLIQLHTSLVKAVNLSEDHKMPNEISKSTDESSQNIDTQQQNNYRSLFRKISSVDISVSQTVLNLEKNEKSKCIVSFSTFNLQASLNPRLEKIFSIGLLQSFMISISDDINALHQIIINPWTCGLEISVSWEPWRDLPVLSPIYQIALDADILLINLGITEILFIQELSQYWITILNNKTENKTQVPLNYDRKRIEKCNLDYWSQNTNNDQYYKDDLRAGAFKYVNCVNDTVPLPYQVVIGQRQICWCYPHPRALTRLYSYPLPFQLESTFNATNTVVCTLQYYSEITQSFIFYAKFYICQDQAVKLDLPINDQYMKLATVWRIEMHLPSEDEDSLEQTITFDKAKFLKPISSKSKQPIIISDFCKTQLPVSPKMLPGCLRVDSYSSSNALPIIQFAMKLPQLSVRLYNTCNNLSAFKFADKDKLFTLDNVLPPSYVYANININNNILEGSVWNQNTGIINYNFDFNTDILNNSDFSLSRSLWCRQSQGTLWWGGKSKKSSDMKPLQFHKSSNQELFVNGLSLRINRTGMKIGSHTMDTLFVATKKCSNTEFCSKCDNVLHIEDLVHRYIIKNDTCVALRISQDGTNETILLASRMSTLYQWPYHKKPHLLNFTAHDGDWHTAKGFQIDECGIQRCELIGEPGLPSLGAVIYVEELGPCHRSVTLSGCMTLFNLLDEKIEFKLYQKKANEKPMVSPVFTVQEKSQNPSLFVDTSCESALRIHFVDSPAGWTGDIPLKPCPKGTLPWLVKVPVKSESGFLCLWCRVLNDTNSGRILVVLSPLYMIRSHFSRYLEVTLASEESETSLDCCIFGKGKLQPLKLPGTTHTKHNIIFDNENVNQQQQKGLQVPFTFDRDLCKNKCTTNTTDFDTTLDNLKNWLREPTSWPAAENDFEDFEWTHLHSNCPEEIIVRFNYDVESIDSVIIEISPWTYFCNYSELDLVFIDSSKEEMCTLEHRHIATPPITKVNPYFYVGLIDQGYYNLSQPLAISTDADETHEESLNVINISKIFFIHCKDSLSLFSVSHDTTNSINTFKFSCKYILLNQTKYNLWLAPLAVPNISIDKQKLSIRSTNIEKKCIQVFSNDNCCSGKSITRFFLPHNFEYIPDVTCAIDDFAFYIWLGLSLDSKCFGCPIRVDKFTSRRCTSLKIDNTSIPITINCKEENDQTYILISEDYTPQFLIQNNADVCIAVGHAFINFTGEEHTCEIVEECETYEWNHQIDAYSQSHYTMPSIAKNYPEMSSDNTQTLTHLAFAFANYKGDSCASKYVWSTPVNVNVTSSEQCVKLPGYDKDIKVSVICHVHSTYITLDNISQVDIPAGKIRTRLLNSMEATLNYDDVSDSDQLSLYEDVEPIISSINSSSLTNANECNQAIIYPSTLLRLLDKMNILFTLSSINITLNSNGQKESKDISSLSCQNVIFTSLPNFKGANIDLTVLDFQLDNQLHSSGEYDFPVVLLKNIDYCDVSEIKDNKHLDHNCFEKKLKSIQEFRKDALIKFKVIMDIWNHEHQAYSAINEISITCQPLSAYIEDTYITILFNYISEFGPWNNESSCPCIKLNKFSTDVTSIYIPYDIASEMSSLVRPLQIGSLKIDPINVVLSLHANLQVYIGLDHSPLQFSKFERNNVLTTSYRLGHALTMHYLSEAIYRAGWVVGSLEILGCPGGLARRVGAGLKALVAEPCRGLLGKGPWGFIVGMTHGSALLLKHVTQGTAESVSMVASNVARNLERLSLDTEYVRKTEAARRAKPRGLPQGLARGFKALALGVVGGATGLMTNPPTRGILGVVTKPLSATADLVAFTTQGLLGQVGWDPQPQAIEVQSEDNDDWQSEWQEWRIRLGRNFLTEGFVLYACKGRHRDTGNSIAIIITTKWILIIDLEREKVQQIVDISTLSLVSCEGTDLCIGIHKEISKQDMQEHISRARVAAYIGENTPSFSSTDDLLRITITPNDVSYVVSVLNMAKNNAHNFGFGVL